MNLQEVLISEGYIQLIDRHKELIDELNERRFLAMKNIVYYDQGISKENTKLIEKQKGKPYYSSKDFRDLLQVIIRFESEKTDFLGIYKFVFCNKKKILDEITNEYCDAWELGGFIEEMQGVSETNEVIKKVISEFNSPWKLIRTASGDVTRVR